MEQRVYQGDGSELFAVLRLLHPHTAAPHLPERAFRRDKRRHWPGIVGLCRGRAAVPTVQRIYRRFVQPEEGVGFLYVIGSVLRGGSVPIWGVPRADSLVSGRLMCLIARHLARSGEHHPNGAKQKYDISQKSIFHVQLFL